MNKSPENTRPDVDDRLSALISNASAIRAITGAVEGTLGPMGLDTMLVDRSGDMVVTNAGVTILDMMEVSHPAARMLISIARAQHDEIGDGTTTATVMAGAMMSEGLSRILKGVPVSRILDGIEKGVETAVGFFREMSAVIDFPDDPMLESVAMVAGRGNEEIARGTARIARIMGKERLNDATFKLRDSIIALENAENEVFSGIILKKRPLNDSTVEKVENAVILCLDDSLDMEKPEEGSLTTEAGFQRYLEKQREFHENIARVIKLGVNTVFITRGTSDRVEEQLNSAGVFTATRLTSGQMKSLCDYTGALAIKKSFLEKDSESIKSRLGSAETVYFDRKIRNIRVQGGTGKTMATFIVGAPTGEVTGEKERISRDSASSIQSAVKGGVVPGGGAAELAVSLKLADLRNSLRGMSAHGVDCVIEALRRPMVQIIQNAGFNPLEKVEEVISAQVSTRNPALALDCDTGQVADMLEMNIIDPALVKIYALRTAGEVARAILRINTIIKMRDSNIPGVQGFTN